MRRPAAHEAFTLIEMLAVVALIVVLLSIAAVGNRKLKREAWLTTQRAQMKQIIDQSVIRGAIRTPQEYEDAMSHLEWQINIARKQGN